MHTGPQSKASTWAFGISLVGFVVLGLTDGAIGAVWPDLRDDFGRTDGSFGQMFGCALQRNEDECEHDREQTRCNSV